MGTTRHQNGKGKPTNVICVELVDADQNADGRGPERPGRDSRDQEWGTCACGDSQRGSHRTISQRGLVI